MLACKNEFFSVACQFRIMVKVGIVFLIIGIDLIIFGANLKEMHDSILKIYAILIIATYAAMATLTRCNCT